MAGKERKAKKGGRRGAAARPARKGRMAAEPAGDRLDRARRILDGLKALYHDAGIELHHRSALELLVATILSAQSTDVTVNAVTPVLFGRFPDAAAIAGADPLEVEGIIHSTGFFHQKTRSVQGACRRIVEAFEGKVPDTMEDLVTLPGVARKTANVVLGSWFKKNEGIVVDTHVGRLAHRLGLTPSSKDEKDAVKIEEDLLKLFPKEEWTFLGHGLILHGRRVCAARKPKCEDCSLNRSCPSAFTCGQGSS